MNALAPVIAVAAASALVDRSALLAAAEKAVLVTEKRNTYPILANVRLRGDGGTLFMSATDLDIMLDVAVPAAADSDFDITIPAFMLRDLLKGAPKVGSAVSIVSPDIKVTQVPTGEFVAGPDGEPERGDDGEPIRIMRDQVEFDGPALVDFEAAKYKLLPLSPDGWPTIAGPVKEWRDAGVVYRNKGFRSFAMPGADLHAALAAVEFAISNEETRYYLNGVYFHTYASRADGEPRLRFVTTDGHRLACQELALPEGAKGMQGVILPKATAYLLLKLLKPAKGKPSPMVTIEVTEDKVRLMFDDVTVTSKTVAGTFPDYERVTPKHNDKLATFPVAAMLESIKAVSMIASDRGGKAVKLEITAGICTMSVTNPDNGMAESSFPITQEFDGPFEIGFNARYLTDLVTEAKADGDAVTMAFNDSGSPTLVTGSRGGWHGVLMPMRV